MATTDYRVKKNIDEIFKLINYPLVTPQALLDNLDLEHYSKITYTKCNEQLMVELNCSVLGRETKYLYTFDTDKKLQTILSKVENEEPYLIFSRSDSLKASIQSYQQISKEKAC